MRQVIPEIMAAEGGNGESDLKAVKNSLFGEAEVEVPIPFLIAERAMLTIGYHVLVAWQELYIYRGLFN